ncbi:MAG: DUF4270 family protein [Flavihumibacter sp.]
MAVFLAGLWACTKETQYIETVSPVDNPYLVQVDTISGSFSTFRPDSFLTSSASYGIAGYIKDPLLGTVYAAHHFRYTLPTWDDIPNNTAFDSLELVLKLNHVFTGDTSVPLRLTVDRLSQALTNEKSTFYNNSNIAADGGRLGEFNALVRPRATDSIRILLSPAFGEELFKLMRTRGSAVSTADKFTEYFKGLRIAGDSTQPSMLLQFKDSVALRLHYHKNDVVNQKEVITFNKAGSPNKFNRIVQRFAGTQWAALDSRLEVNAANSNNLFAIEEFNRIRTQIVFPYIKNVLQASDYVKVMGATLEIRPMSGSTEKFPLANSLQLYQQREDGALAGPMTNSEGTAMNGSLFIDNIYGKDTRYTFDVSNYILAQMSADNFTATRLVMAGVGGDSTLTRVVGNTTAASNLRSRLILTLLVYKKQS